MEILSWQSGGDLVPTHNLRSHTRVVSDLNWHRFDPNVLASCSIDTYIHIWDIRDHRRPAMSLSAVGEEFYFVKITLITLDLSPTSPIQSTPMQLAPPAT